MTAALTHSQSNVVNAQGVLLSNWMITLKSYYYIKDLRRKAILAHRPAETKVTLGYSQSILVSRSQASI